MPLARGRPAPTISTKKHIGYLLNRARVRASIPHSLLANMYMRREDACCPFLAE